MVKRLFLFVLFLGATASGVIYLQARPHGEQKPPVEDHVAWVAESLKQIQTIKPGMTRGDLLKVFTTEGGLSTGLQRTYVSQNCPYFKVDVQFKAVGRPDHDAEGRVPLDESSKDIIVKISRPYLQFSVMD